MALLEPLDQRRSVFCTGVWLSRRMMATVDKTSVAIYVSCQVDCLVPTWQRLTRSQLQACSVGGVEMWVLSTSPAERRGELLFFFSIDLHSYCRLPYYVFLPKPRGSQFWNSLWHLRLFTTSSIAYFSSWHCSHSPAVCHRWKDRAMRWVFMCPNCMGVDRRGEQILSSLKEAETGH